MNSRFCSVLVASVLAGAVHAESLSRAQLYALTCEHLQNPIGLGTPEPRLSWKIRSAQLGERQTAYQIRAATSAARFADGKPDLWDSEKIISDQSVLVPWGGSSLGSRSQSFWQVRIWDKDGRPSHWSETAHFELGLLNPGEWKAKWLTANLPCYDVEQVALGKALWINAGSFANQAAAVRLQIILPANAAIRSATLDAAADGLLTVYANGHANRQGSSSRTAPLRADIRAELVPGTNIIAIGSAAVRNAVRRDSGAVGRNAIAARVLLKLMDGSHLEFNTDASWRAAVAPGSNWFAPDFDDSNWSPATVIAPYAEQPSRYCDNTIGPGRYLRVNFTLKKPVAKARLYATALGVYEASINGRRVNQNSVLDPGWTDYTRRVMVQTFDVTSLLSRGANALGAVLGDGWYAGRVGWMGLAQYGSRPAFAAQLEITYTDNSTECIVTDESWKAGSGEIVGADLQWGEILDARKLVDWDQPSFNDASWSPAVVEQHRIALEPQRGPPVRMLLELAPTIIMHTEDKWLVDFGQNLVGHVRLSARGPAGTVITVRHGEMLSSDGSLYTENLRPALATDTFILNGKGRNHFEPRFTFHGFRYAEITGYPGKLSAGDVRAIVVSSDTPQTGTWECSNPDLNRLFSNIIWGQRGNFLSVPTDCPQRDERMGWMGDAQVFAPTAARNADVSSFFTKWMVDVNDGQSSRGDFGNYSPRVAQPQPGWPVWGDAGVIIPWAMFTSYGDKAFLANNYTNMTHWLDYCQRASKDLILTGGVGDHLAPRRTPVEVVDTAYFANSARIVATAAAILGKTEDAERYKKLCQDIVDAFDRSFVSTNGAIRGDTQTAYILALQFALLPESLRAPVAQRLINNVKETGHLTTGFVGVGLICPTLAQIGRSDLAWQLLLTDSYPSWLFSVENGATTIWERWDGWTPEKGFQDSSMNSFNHYSFGSVGAWLYSGAAGIELDEAHPGYKHFSLRPQFTSRLTRVAATLDSPYGLIASAWYTQDKRVCYDVTIPPNTTADVSLPVPSKDVSLSGKPLSVQPSPTTGLLLDAGKYHFSFPRELLLIPN